MKTVLIYAALASFAVAAERPATLLAAEVAALASEPIVIAAADPAGAEAAGEAAEAARLERLPVVAIPIQDETLAGAITTIASACGMNFIAPAPEEFPERITLTTKVNPWRLLNRLSERHRFGMAYREGIWEFNREPAGSLIARVYALKHTNLDVYKASQNAFSTIGAVSNLGGGGSAGMEGGLVFSAQTQKIIEDIRDLIGLPSAQLRPDSAADAPADGRPRPLETIGTASAKVIYLADANALYVACTRAQHDLVAGYLRLADQPPRQVRIEARFFETSWQPKTVLGINPENFQPNVTLSSLQGQLDLDRMAFTADRALLSMDSLSLQLRALHSDERSRLVQNPTVVTANNREVYFSVGDEEPFVSSNNTYPGMPNTGFGATTASVSIRRIGTSVNVVPTVFEGEPGGKRRIRLVVRIEVGALKGFRQINAVSIPVVASQKYEYTTYVEEGQALAFGGLSGIGESEGVTKVPLAGDVPVIGYLFKSKRHELQQRNLVAYIIARVVEGSEPAVMPDVRLERPLANSGFGHSAAKP